jgi:hypothetical protein
MMHLKAILLSIACLSLMACGTRTPEISSTTTPIPEEAPTPTPVVETPTPEIEPIPEPVLDFSSSVNTQIEPDSRIPGTWSTVGRLLNHKNEQYAFVLPDDRIVFAHFGYTDQQWNETRYEPLVRHFGEGEMFNPKTGQSTPFKGFDYNWAVQLQDGRIVLFHPKRISLFDPASNTFKHFAALPTQSPTSWINPREISGDKLQYGNSETGYFEFSLKNGSIQASNFPANKSIATKYALPEGNSGIGGSFTINIVAFKSPDGSIWELKPDFKPKSEYSYPEVQTGDRYQLSKFDQSLNIIEASVIKLPINIQFAHFLNSSTIDFVGRVHDSYFENCEHNYFDLNTKKITSRYEYYCGRYGGARRELSLGSSEVLFFNFSCPPGCASPGADLVNVQHSPVTVKRIQNHFGRVWEVFLLSKSRFFFFGDNDHPAWDRTVSALPLTEDEIKIFDATSHEFKAIAAPIQARSSARTVQLSDGRILLAGGRTEIPVDGQYNPLSAHFEPVDSIEIYTPEN